MVDFCSGGFNVVITKGLSPKLKAEAERIEARAREAGLDFFEVVFESLGAEEVNAVAAYGGFPQRFPSWRFGMDFERLNKGYSYGFSKIYELVINGDPTLAYLVRSNSHMEQKLVMAHVFGHADFFRHNIWFEPTDRGMPARMARHGERVTHWMERVGRDRVERFLDRVLSLDTLLDPYQPQRKRWNGDAADSPYDLLQFLMRRAPLEDWQVELVSIVRAEAYYFLPQRQTKIVNEGWATYWHSKLLTGGLLEDSEIIEFSECHAGATADSGSGLNPYKLGLELLRHAERAGEDLFALRRQHNDLSFLDEYVDADFARSSTLFQRQAAQGQSWQECKQGLLQELAWCGSPRIWTKNMDVEDGAVWVLEHGHDGRDLHSKDAFVLLGELAPAVGRAGAFGDAHRRGERELGRGHPRPGAGFR